MPHIQEKLQPATTLMTATVFLILVFGLIFTFGNQKKSIAQPQSDQKIQIVGQNI